MEAGFGEGNEQFSFIRGLGFGVQGLGLRLPKRSC